MRQRWWLCLLAHVNHSIVAQRAMCVCAAECNNLSLQLGISWDESLHRNTKVQHQNQPEQHQNRPALTKDDQDSDHRIALFGLTKAWNHHQKRLSFVLVHHGNTCCPTHCSAARHADQQSLLRCQHVRWDTGLFIAHLHVQMWSSETHALVPFPHTVCFILLSIQPIWFRNKRLTPENSQKGWKSG